MSNCDWQKRAVELVERLIHHTAWLNRMSNDLAEEMTELARDVNTAEGFEDLIRDLDIWLTNVGINLDEVDATLIHYNTPA